MTKETESAKWYRYAYHEAAHAVAKVALGGAVWKVLIRPKNWNEPFISEMGKIYESSLGLCDGPLFYGPYLLGQCRGFIKGIDSELRQVLIDSIKREIIHSLAGIWGESDWIIMRDQLKINKWSRRFWVYGNGGGSDDYDKALMLFGELRRFGGRARKAEFENHTARLIELPESRAAMTELAERIMNATDNTVEGAVVAEICERHKVVWKVPA